MNRRKDTGYTWTLLTTILYISSYNMDTLIRHNVCIPHVIIIMSRRGHTQRLEICRRVLTYVATVLTDCHHKFLFRIIQFKKIHIWINKIMVFVHKLTLYTGSIVLELDNNYVFISYDHTKVINTGNTKWQIVKFALLQITSEL